MKFFTLLIGLFFSTLSFAFSEQELVQQLQQPQSIQGHFTQQRFLKALAKPITMQGKFALVAQKGLLWQLETPFANSLRVKPNGISQWNGSQWVNNSNMAQTEQIGLFLGLLSGNIDGLKSQFNLHLQGDKKQWHLTLTPNTLLMQQIFTSIEIKGDDVVKFLELNEKQGDRSVIEFQQIKQNQPLSDFAQQALN